METIQTMVKNLPDIPWGIYLDDDADKKTASLEGEGYDFVVFSASGRISVTPQEEKVGRILQVAAAALDDGLLRAVNDLPVDAVLAAGEEPGGAVAWHHLMQVQRLSNLLAKPLLVDVPAGITEVEIKALWEAGADGVVVAADGLPPGGLSELRRLIDGLPPRSARRRGKSEALLPRIGRGTSPAAEEEEEDDDWDDE